MKNIYFILVLFVPATLLSQHLESIYKGGDVSLVADADYGKNNDWNKIFADFSQNVAFGFDSPRKIGISKEIVVAPDGSVFMSHHTRHSISKFDKNGNFIKEFGQKGSRKADFIYMPIVQGILDKKYLYTTSVDGRMLFFDFNGQWLKTIKLKYMPLGTTPLKGGKIAIVGHVPWKGGSKNIISILNVANGSEKIISSNIEGFVNEKEIVIRPLSHRSKNDSTKTVMQHGGMVTYSIPFTHAMYYRVRIATSAEGNLIAGYPATGDIIVYNPAGQILKQFKADIKPEVVTKDDREKYYQKALDDVSKREEKSNDLKDPDSKKYHDDYLAQCRSQLEKFRDPKSYPANLPYFSGMIVDPENNILLFRFTREEGSNQFDVYTLHSAGSKIATSRFVTDNYELKISPSMTKFAGMNIYSFLKIKDATGNPMRLVKFKLQNTASL
jgi:hypothetical protein